MFFALLGGFTTLTVPPIPTRFIVPTGIRSAEHFGAAAVTVIGGESTDGTSVTTVGPAINASPTPGSTGSGNLLTITSGGQIALNGVVISAYSGTSGVVELFYLDHTAWQFNGTSWFGPITATSPGGGPVTSPIPTISLSGNVVETSSPVGTTVGALSVTTGLPNGTIGSGAYTWTLTLSGTNAGDFQVYSGNLQTAVSSLAAGSYTLTVTATNPGVTGSYTLPVTVMVSAFTPVLTSITTVGSYTYTVPSCLFVDVILLGGGGGGGVGDSGGGGDTGEHGFFNAVTLRVGVDVTAGQVISGVVGNFGAGATAPGTYVNGHLGGSTTATATGWAGLTATGGLGGQSWDYAHGGYNGGVNTPGTEVFNSQSYVGGGTAGTNQVGMAPGGGGGQASPASTVGYRGAVGAAWFYAY
jgi:hypothetical protein